MTLPATTDLQAGASTSPTILDGQSTDLVPSKVVKGFTAFSQVAASLTLAVGALGLLGWLLDLRALTSVVLGLQTMKPNTAACFVLAGISLLLLHASESRSGLPATGAWLAAAATGAAVCVIGALTLSEYVFGWNIGIDQWLFDDAAPQPGRMAAATAVGFVCAGVALELLLMFKAEPALQVGQALAVAVLVIGTLALLGYLLDYEVLYHVGPFSSVAPNTAFAFLALGSGLLAAHPGTGWMREFAADTGSARLARQLALGTIVLVPGLAWVRLEAQDLGLFETEFGVAIHAVAGLVLFLGLMWLATRAANRTEGRLTYLAYYDPLTGLANRTLFSDRLAQHVVEARRLQLRLALVLFNVDKLQRINSAFGRNAGDELLRKVGRRLERSAANSFAAARIDSGRFAVTVLDVKGERDAARTCDNILASTFAESFNARGHDVQVGAHAGIAIYPQDGVTADQLLQSADAALAEATARGVKYQLCNQASSSAVFEALRLETALHRAIENEQLVLHYQPKVEMRTRRIAGVEALLRWQSPELGLVSPAQFIPLMEESGLIVQAGGWALAQAARDARRLADAGLDVSHIAVNVSAIQLRRSDFVDSVARAVAANPASLRLELEITESALMRDIETVVPKLQQLRDLGFTLAIDDFGTGHSSLQYLAKLPVQSLKIERSFVQPVLQDAAAATLVRTIVGLAHSLGLRVVAEGVESEEQAKFVEQAGCDEMQGYLFSKPLPFDELVAFLKRAQPEADRRGARLANVKSRRLQESTSSR